MNKKVFIFKFVTLYLHCQITILFKVIHILRIYLKFPVFTRIIPSILANIYLLQVNNKNTRKRCARMTSLMWLNIFHTFFQYFFYWLGTNKEQVCMDFWCFADIWMLSKVVAVILEEFTSLEVLVLVYLTS